MNTIKLLDTFGSKYWRRLDQKVKFDLLMKFERWKDPKIDPKTAFTRALVTEMLDYTEMSFNEQHQFRRFLISLKI